MPEGLPSSSGLSLNTAAKQPVSCVTTSTPSVVIQTSGVLTSVCDTLLSSATPTPTTPVSHSSVNIVVVSTETKCSQVNHESISNTSTSTTSYNYRLSEIVHQEKDTWFKQDKDSHKQEEDSAFELEPPRAEVLSVRRRSRQFFTLVEEDEVDSDKAVVPATTNTDPTEKQPEVFIEPVFHLGESLKRLYFPKEHQQNRQKIRKTRISSDSNKEKVNSQPTSEDSYRPSSAGFDRESDKSKMGLFDKVFKNPEINIFSSQPCISDIPDIDNHEVTSVGSLKSKSLPTTPRVSPKLLRKKSLYVDEHSESKGPGSSFLASVAGELRYNKLKMNQKHDQELQRFSETNKKHGIVKTEDKVLPLLSQKGKQSSVVSNKPDLESNAHHLESTHHVSDFSDYLGNDYKPENPKPFMKSLIEWSTQKKMKMTNQETNMYSPTSF